MPDTKETRPLLGLRRVEHAMTFWRERSYHPAEEGKYEIVGPVPDDTEIWVPSYDIEDMRGSGDWFVQGGTFKELREAFGALHPSPDSRLTYVMSLRARSGPTTTYFLVHKQPYVNIDKCDFDAEFERLCVLHGPFLFDAEREKGVREDKTFHASNFVIGRPSTSCDYLLLKVNPSRAAVRRGTGGTRAEKRAEKRERERLEDKARRGCYKLAAALLRAISAEFALPLVLSLPENHGEMWEERVWEPGSWGNSGRWRGTSTYTRYEDAGPGAYEALERLHEAARLHEKFFGKRAYRRVPEWELLRADCRAVPGFIPFSLTCEQRGARTPSTSAYAAAESWWYAEMRAKAPRKRKTEPEPEGPHGAVDAGREGADDRAEEAVSEDPEQARATVTIGD